MAVITFSSSFGSGGSVIAGRVAQRLGWDLHNRAIPLEVAARLSLPLEAALANDEASETRVGRVLARFSVQLASESVGNIPVEVFVGDESFRKRSEATILNLANSSNCVIVGRAAAIVLRNFEAALHVRLDGNPERRVIQAAEALDISIEESTKRLIETDRARRLYVEHFYNCDWEDARLYHLVLDSTNLSLGVCVEMIIAKAARRFASADVQPETTRG